MKSRNTIDSRNERKKIFPAKKKIAQTLNEENKMSMYCNFTIIMHFRAV